MHKEILLVEDNPDDVELTGSRSTRPRSPTGWW